MSDEMTRDIKILLLNGLRRGSFDVDEVRILTKYLGGLLSFRQTTADEEIEKLSAMIGEPIERKIPTPHRQFTPAFRKVLISALKKGCFDIEERDALREFLNIGDELAIVIVETREQVEELNRLESITKQQDSYM